VTFARFHLVTRYNNLTNSLIKTKKNIDIVRERVTWGAAMRSSLLWSDLLLRVWYSQIA